MPSTPSLARMLMHWLALSALTGAVLGALLSAARGGTLADFAVTAAISTLYSASIGLPAMLVFRRLPSRVRGRPEATQWLIYAGALLAISAAGTLVAGLVLVAVGFASLDELWGSYFGGLQIALAISVPVTIGAMTFSKLRVRLANTEQSLHVKELEHQRALGLATEARLASLESRVRETATGCSSRSMTMGRASPGRSGCRATGSMVCARGSTRYMAPRRRSSHRQTSRSAPA